MFGVSGVGPISSTIQIPKKYTESPTPKNTKAGRQNTRTGKQTSTINLSDALRGDSGSCSSNSVQRASTSIPVWRQLNVDQLS